MLISQAYDASTETWSIHTNPPILDLPLIDYIYFATGIPTDFTTLPLQRTMNTEYPIPSKGGLPCLTDDLMWTEDVPLFIYNSTILRVPISANVENA